MTPLPWTLDIPCWVLDIDNNITACNTDNERGTPMNDESNRGSS